MIVHGYKLCIKNITHLLTFIKERVYESIALLRRNIKLEGGKLDGNVHRQVPTSLQPIHDIWIDHAFLCV